MDDPNLELLKTFVQSPEFVAAKSAADALPQELLLVQSVGAHLNAFRLGAERLAKIQWPEPEDEGEPLEP